MKISELLKIYREFKRDAQDAIDGLGSDDRDFDADIKAVQTYLKFLNTYVQYVDEDRLE